MKRCFIDPDNWPQNEGILSAAESHHLLAVLRSQPGEIIEIFDGQGKTAQAELVAREKNIAQIKVVPASIRSVEPCCPSFTLLQAVPKHSGMDMIIQKATELGVQIIIPVITERVVVKFKDRDYKEVGQELQALPNKQWRCEDAHALPVEKRVVRWQKIALAAAKQCHSAWLPEIREIVPLAEVVGELRSDLRLFGSLAPQLPLLKEVLAGGGAFNDQKYRTGHRPGRRLERGRKRIISCGAF